MRGEAYDLFNTAHAFTGIHLTEKGLDLLEKYMADVRAEVGWDVPIAIDHLGHIPYEDAVALLRRLEKYHLSWAEDVLPWQNTQDWVRLHAATTTPLGTGEDIYLKENFRPLLVSGALAVVHPDVLAAGGILETKKVGDLVKPALSYEGGFITVPTKPGLGIDELNETLITRQLHPSFPTAWEPTDAWDQEWSNDRHWS